MPPGSRIARSTSSSDAKPACAAGEQLATRNRFLIEPLLLDDAAFDQHIGISFDQLLNLVVRHI